MDLSAQLLLDLVQIQSIVPSNQIDSKTKMSKSPGTPNAMEISLCIFWEIEVDDNVDGLNVDTTSEQIRADKVARDSGSEVVEDLVAVLLHHLRMRVEARVTKFRDFLGKQLNPAG